MRRKGAISSLQLESPGLSVKCNLRLIKGSSKSHSQSEGRGFESLEQATLFKHTVLDEVQYFGLDIFKVYVEH